MVERKETKDESVGEKVYEPDDYKRSSLLSSGLAKTHEQATDAYNHGSLDGEKEGAIERGSYDKKR